MSSASNTNQITEVNMSDYNVGEIARAKVGRNLVEVEILECGEGSYKVKSLSSGREFYTVRLEKINNNNMEAFGRNIQNRCL